ncbi:MAG: class B sortase [Clostridia bacterium]|nr:class B sortase [Clostridia bacterium]
MHSGLLALHERNPDCVAWITIEGTVIDYPVMYRPNPKNYYLHRDFNGNHASAGALFIAENCDPDDGDNVIIYGHHMNSGKMFAALNQYKKQSFYEEHRRIVYETLHGQETYEVMFAFTTPVYTGHDFEYYAFSKANGAEEYDAYISACRERALYDTGVTARYGDKLLTLSTCEYSQKNGRMVVVARKIDE